MRIESIAVDTKAFQALANLAAEIVGPAICQLTPVGSGLLAFTGRENGIRVMFLPTEEVLLYLSLDQARDIQSIVPSLNFLWKNVKPDFDGLKLPLIERLCTLTAEELFGVEQLAEPEHWRQQDLMFSGNPKVIELLRWTKLLTQFEQEQGEVDNLEFTGAVNGVVVQYNRGKLQFVFRTKISPSGHRRYDYDHLWNIEAEGLSVGGLEREIQSWIDRESEDWSGQQQVCCFLQQLSNVKRPMVLPKHW